MAYVRKPAFKTDIELFADVWMGIKLQPRHLKVMEMVSQGLDMGDKFKTPMDIALYVKEHNIPVGFYFNFTDTPAENVDEVIDYLEWESKRDNA